MAAQLSPPMPLPTTITSYESRGFFDLMFVDGVALTWAEVLLEASTSVLPFRTTFRRKDGVDCCALIEEDSNQLDLDLVLDCNLLATLLLLLLLLLLLQSGDE